jgi:CheY-like chemotaxis protein
LTKVLIVDDDRTMVSLLKTLFEIQGYQVLTALQEDAVLAVLRDDVPDVVFMDVFLSGLDGLDLLRQIRAAKDLEGLRVIMTSGMDVSDACLEAGANAFLMKPYTPDQLLELIQQNVPPPGISAAKGG